MKRVLSVLLALCLLICMVPFAASAADNVFEDGDESFPPAYNDSNLSNSISLLENVADPPPEPTPDPTPNPGFIDMPANQDFANAITWAVEQGVTTGTGGGRFSPDQSCTRAQIVTFLWRAADKPDVTVSNAFSDMPADSDFQKAISWAAANGVTTGTGGGKFSPDQGCTRAQIVTFLWRAAGRPDVTVSSVFSDMPANSDFQKAISWAVANGITKGTGNGKFSPNANCTRAQAVTFLYRANI